MANGIDTPIDNQLPKLTVDEFAAKIKAKYPSYANIDNKVLTDKILAKYPQYSNSITTEPIKPPAPSSLPPIGQPQLPFSPLVGDARQQAIQQRQDEQSAMSNRLKKLRSELPVDAQQHWDTAMQAASLKSPDQIRDGSADLEHYNFMQSPVGKTLGAVQYLGSKATKGGLQVARGVAHLAQNIGNPVSAITGNDSGLNDLFDKANDNTNFGLTKGDQSRIETGGGLYNNLVNTGGMAAEFAPAIAGGEALGSTKGLMYLQGLGQGQEQVANLEKNGQSLNPAAKELLIQGSGVVNLALEKFGDNILGKVPNALRTNVVNGIVADAVKENAGKDLTQASFKELLNNGVKTFADKFERAPVEAMRHYNETAKTLTKLNVGNYLLHKGVDTVNDKPVFNDTIGDLAEQESKTLTHDAPLFSAIPALRELTKLAPNSSYKNDVVESVVNDPSHENVTAIKQQLYDHGFHDENPNKWTPEEMDATFKHIDQIADVAKKVPSTLAPDKKEKAIDLILGRNELEQSLKIEQDKRAALDPSMAEFPTAKEQFLTDKIDQANDKLKSLVTGKRTTYSKGVAENEGKFFKTTDGKQEEIAPARYDMERVEREAKAQDETTKNSLINSTDNGINETEMGRQPNGQENGQGGNESNGSQESSQENVKGSGNEKNIREEKGNVIDLGGEQPPINAPADEQGPRNTQTENTVQKQPNQQKPAGDSGEKAAEAPVGEETSKEISTGAETPKTVAENKSPASPKQEASSMSQGDGGVSTKAGDPLRAFADKVRQGKINKLGGFRASTGFDAAWDTSLEVVAKAAEGGAKIADAIEAGLKHIKSTDWYKNLTNKEEFDQQYRDHLSNEYTEVEKALPAKNEANEKVASELGLKVDESNKGKRTNEVIEKEAADAIKKGYDVPKLVDNILNDGHTATDTEVAILAKYRDAKYDEIKAQQEQLASEGATMSKKQFEALTEANDASLNEMQDVVQAIRKTGSITGSALRARQLDLQKEYSLGNMIAQKRQANGGEKLSSEELASVTKRFAEMEEIQKQLEARLKNVEEQNAKLKAEQAIKRSAGARRAVTKSELAAERSKIFDSIRDDFKKIRQSGQAMSDVPYRRELAAVAKHMPALLRNLAQEGVVRIEDVVDNIYTALKGDLEDITKRDVTDLIAGKYNEVKPTRSELQDNIKSLRAQAKLITRIEDAEKGIKPTDKPPVVKQKNEAIDALKARLKELTKEEPQSPEEKSLAGLKKRLQDNIDKLSKKIAEGDYSKEEPKKPVTPDAEALALRRKYDKIKNEFDIEVAKDALKQRSKTEKLKDNLLNIASLPRALKASLDFSAVLRQGLFASVGHPKEALTAFKEMFRQTFSEEKYRNWISDLKHSEFYDLMKNSELYLSDKDDPKIIAREEEFTSNLADKIPGIGKAIAASERAYTGYLNVLRAGVFESQARELIKRGYTFENNPEVFKGVAKVINVLTGRGDVPEFLGGKTPKVLSNVLFSPRFMAARIQTLYLWADPRLPREAKLMAAKDIGATLGTGIALLSLASLAGYKVETDPRSTQFLKIQDKNENGTTYYDILGGLPQYIRLLSQIATGKTVSSTGKVTDLSAKHGRHNPFGQTRGGVEWNFLRGKLAPVPGALWNLQEGRDVLGQPYNLFPQAIPNEFIPLPYTDVQEAYQVGGIKNALKVLLPSQFGVSVSSYNPNAKHK